MAEDEIASAPAAETDEPAPHGQPIVEHVGAEELPDPPPQLSPSDIEVDIDVVEEPPPPRAHIFKCKKKGHLQRGSGELIQIHRDTGEVIARTGPICHQCYLPWMGTMWRTVDTGVEAPFPEEVVTKGD